MDNLELFLEWMLMHRGKIIGVLVGLFLSLSVIFWGILKTLLIVVCVVLGYLGGKQLDDQVNIRERLLRMIRER